MELDLELLFALATLAGTDEWMSAEALGARLGWSRKRVQRCIARLQRLLGDSCIIEAQRTRGYRLAALGDEAREALIRDAFGNETFFNLDERRAVLALDLLFRPDYISMEALGRTYYLSKTTVFEEIQHLKRWFGRIEHLELEVSRQRGIRIQGSELAKRFSAASFAQLHTLRLMGCTPLELERFRDYTERATRLLARDLVTTEHLISGEELTHAVRYLGICWLRTTRGFVIESSATSSCDAGSAADPRRYPAFVELAHYMEPPLSADEERAVATLIAYGNRVALPGAASQHATRGGTDTPAITTVTPQHIAALERHLADALMLEDDHLFPDRALVAVNLETTLERTRRGNHRAQYYDQELIQTAPLFIHLAANGLRETLGIEPARFDLMAFAAMIQGACLRVRARSAVRVMIVGDQDFELLDQLRSHVLACLPFAPARFDLLPPYAAHSLEGTTAAQKDLLLLTTSPLFNLQQPSYALVPPLALGTGASTIHQVVNAWLTARHRALAASIGAAATHTTLDAAAHPNHMIAAAMRTGATVLPRGRNELCIITTRDDMPTGVSYTHLTRPLAGYRYPITRVIECNHRPSEPDAISWFDAALDLPVA